MIEGKKAKDALKIVKDAQEKFSKAGSAKEELGALEALTVLHSAMENPEKALKVAEEAETIATKLSNPKLSARVQLAVAAVNFASEEWEDCIAAYDKCAEICEESNDFEGHSFAMREISYVLTVKKAEYTEGAKAAKAAIESAQRVQDSSAEGYSALFLSFSHATKAGFSEETADKDNQRALSAANEAQELFQDGGNPLGEAHALWMISELKALDKKYEAALEAAEERLQILRDLGQHKMEGSTLISIAGIHMRDDNYPEAEKAAKEAEALFKKKNDTEGQCHALLALCQVLTGQEGDQKTKQSNGSKALKAATEAQSIANTLGDKSLRAQAAYYKAAAHLYSETYQEAVRTSSEAAQLFNGAEDYKGECKAFILGASVNSALGQIDKALEMADKAVRAAREIGDQEMEFEAGAMIQRIEASRAPPAGMMMMPQQQQMMMPQMAADPGAGAMA